jgi:hypothetical protein
MCMIQKVCTHIWGLNSDLLRQVFPRNEDLSTVLHRLSTKSRFKEKSEAPIYGGALKLTGIYINTGVQQEGKLYLAFIPQF